MDNNGVGSISEMHGGIMCYGHIKSSVLEN